MADPMTAPSGEAIRQLVDRARAYIFALVNHGAEVCGTFTPKPEMTGWCAACGYSECTHVYKELAALDAYARLREMPDWIRLFLSALPDVPCPEACVESDGDVAFDWWRAPHCTISASVSATGRVAWAGLTPDGSRHGDFQLPEMSPVFLDTLVLVSDAKLDAAPGARETPPSESPCAKCGGPHPFDTSVPSVLWNRVIRAASLPDYLCTTCIVRAFAEAGVSFEAELTIGHKIRVIVDDAESAAVAEIQAENNRLRCAYAFELDMRPVATGGYVAPPESTEAAVLRELRAWLEDRISAHDTKAVAASVHCDPNGLRHAVVATETFRFVLAKLDALSAERGGRT